MELSAILRLPHGSRVDRVLGRIDEIGDVRDEPSKFGPPQKVQDVVLELPDRSRVAVQFFDLSLRNFTGSKTDHGVCADFDYRVHKGFWIEIWDTQKDQGKKPSLSRIVSKPNPGKQKPTGSRHWEAKGVPALLKATRTVGIQWRLEKGAGPPKIGHINHKKLKGLAVPGEETNVRVSKESSDKPVPPREPASPNERPAEGKPKGVDNKRLIMLGVELSFQIEDTLRSAYETAKIQVTEAFIVEAAKSISVRLNRVIWKDMRTKIGNMKQEQLDALIKGICISYARMHYAYLEGLKKRGKSIPDEPMLRTKITTAISLIEDDLSVEVPR